jgi:hypothetical protein
MFGVWFVWFPFIAFFAASRLLSSSGCLHLTTISSPTRLDGFDQAMERTQRRECCKILQNDAKLMHNATSTSMWKHPGTSSAGHNTKPAGAVAGWESCGWSSWTAGSQRTLWLQGVTSLNCGLDKQTWDNVTQQQFWLRI